MRLDLYLKISRIIKRRPLAKKLCDDGKILVNGNPAKASYDVKVGDIIEVDYFDKKVQYKVIRVPERKGVSRSDARELSVILKTTRKEILP